MRPATWQVAALAGLVAAALPAATPPSAARDLGTMPLSGQMAIEWTAIEPEPDSVFTARYRIRGGIDGDGAGDREAMLAGFEISCIGTMRFGRGMLFSDVASCRATDRYGNGLWLDITAGKAPWASHTLKVTFGDGTGPYARVRGAGELTRLMHLPPRPDLTWGFFNGTVRWRLG